MLTFMRVVILVNQHFVVLVIVKLIAEFLYKGQYGIIGNAWWGICTEKYIWCCFGQVLRHIYVG